MTDIILTIAISITSINLLIFTVIVGYYFGSKTKDEGLQMPSNYDPIGAILEKTENNMALRTKELEQISQKMLYKIQDEEPEPYTKDYRND